jgi:uncharacterized protein
VSRRFRFVAGEAAAAQLDAESEDDVLALTRDFDLQELVEDELLLALPIVPMHAECPEPLPRSETDHKRDAVPNPFAVLASLRRETPDS